MRGSKVLVVGLAWAIAALPAFADPVEIALPPGETVKQKIDLPAAASLRIENTRGPVTIFESDDGAVHVKVVNKGDKPRELQFDASKSGALSIEVPGGSEAPINIQIRSSSWSSSSSTSYSYSYTSTTSSSSSWSWSARWMDWFFGWMTHFVSTRVVSVSINDFVSLEVSVPPQLLLNLDAQCSSGRLKLEGAFAGESSSQRKAKLDAKMGKVDVDEFQASQLVVRAQSDISLTDTAAAVTATTSMGQIHTTKTVGALKLNAQSDIVVKGGVGLLTATTSMGKVTVNDLDASKDTGTVVIRSQSDVKLTGVRANQIDVGTSMGKVTTTEVDVAGEMIIRAQSDLKINGGTGGVKALTSMGRISASDHEGDLLLQSQSDIEARDNTGNINATCNMGTVVITGQTNGTVQARTSMGDIRFNNPKATSETARGSHFSKIQYTACAKSVENEGRGRRKP